MKKMALYGRSLVLLIVIATLCVSSAAALSACGGGEATLHFYIGDELLKTVAPDENGAYSLPDATRDGYTFGGWYLDQGTWQQPFTETSVKDDKLSGEINVYANMTAVTYTISYELNGGSNASANPSSYTAASTVRFAEPSRQYYSFGGWYRDSNFRNRITDTSGVYENLTLYANWSVRTHKVTYHLNGGDNHPDNPATFRETDARIELQAPTKQGYAFAGWYSDEACTQSVPWIKKNTTADVELWANWEISKDSFLFTDVENAFGGWGKAIAKNPARILPADLVIPSQMDGMDVLQITDYGFRDAICTTMTLPTKLQRIGVNAFARMKNLSGMVVIPDSVTMIGKGIFRECDRLEYVVLSSGLTSLTQNTFYQCSSLKWVVFPKEITEIQNNAFFEAGGNNGVTIYYTGTQQQWNNIHVIGTAPQKISYYVEAAQDVPTDGGSYWHYGADGMPTLWE